MAARLNNTTDDNYQRHLEQADVEIDNLRAAFVSSLEDREIQLALMLASSLQPLWQSRGRVREGGSWFDTVFAEQDAWGVEVAPAVRARALADQAMLGITQNHENSNRAEQALAIARELDDPALLAHALIACGTTTTDPAVALPHLAEAQALAGALDDRAVLSHIYGWQTYGGILMGDPIAARAAGEKGRDVAEAVGNRFASRWSRLWLGLAQLMLGDLRTATAQFGVVAAEAEAAHDTVAVVLGRMALGYALAHQGETDAARAAAADAIAASIGLGPAGETAPYSAAALAALAAGEATAARSASEALVQHVSMGQPGYVVIERVLMAQSELASGDAIAARRWADDAVATTMGWYRMMALTARARVAMALGELDRAERDLLDALVIASEVQAGVGVADVLECLAGVRGAGGGSPDPARLYGAAHAIRERVGESRFAVYQTVYDFSVVELRQTLGDSGFESAWAEGAALSIKEALAYAARGKGGRKRPSSGWDSLTPTERDVAGLVTEGLANKDVATRLFISPRTVQTHLTRVYNKLGVTNRVQLTQEAARNS
jgi:DNA-binding CsgD family transcriptional regulator